MIQLSSVSKAHGSQILFLDASLSARKGERVGLVGPNGCGKSTVFRLIMQQEEADGGQVSVERNATLGYFSQDVGEMRDGSVLEATLAGAGEVSQVAAELKALEEVMADPDRLEELEKSVERFGEVQSRFDELDGYTLEARAQEVLAGLGFRESVIEDQVGNLSGGWKMRVALARILLMQPDGLLLDEPTNHLDIESIIWLEQFLHDFDGALIITSHDREFLNRVVTKIVEIDGGNVVSYSGDYDFYQQQRALAEAQQDAQYARQQAMLAKEKAFIARFKARASHAAQVQSRVKKLDKIDTLVPPKRRQVIGFDFRAPPRSGEDVANLQGVNKRYGDITIFEDLDLVIRRKERWCVMGVNGAGKSTLLKLIVGEVSPDSGSVRLGPSVKVAYFAQHSMELLDERLTVYETLESEFPVANVGSLKTLAAAFGFRGDDVDKYCHVLSGGEKARLVLATMLFDPPNFLVLDEPSNHLDMDTKAMLVDALSNFEGTMLMVSHDRHFLTALSDHVLELTPEGLRVYGGGYAEYVVASGHEAPGLGA